MATPDISRFLQASNGGTRCTVAIALDTLDDADAQFLREVLAHPLMVAARVEALSKDTWGTRLPSSSVRRHVMQRCACE